MLNDNNGNANRETTQQLVLGFLAQFTRDMADGTLENGSDTPPTEVKAGQAKPGRVANGLHTKLFLDGRGLGKARKLDKGNGELDHQRDGKTLVRTFRLMSGTKQEELDDEYQASYIPDSEEMFPNSCVHFHKFYNANLQLVFAYFREEEWLLQRELLKPHDEAERERIKGALHVTQRALIFMITNLEL